MIRRGALVVAALSLVTACGGGSGTSGIVARHATATVIATGDGVQVAEVSLVLHSAADDELRSASVPRSVAGRVSVAAYAGSSGGDGHLGHLDPKPGSSHTHDRRLAIDLPAAQDVKVGPGGVAQIRVRDLVAPLRPGDEFQLTLTFETATKLVVPVTVTR
ncbi:MAG: hypothetical protein U0Q22_06100 [Acidimicrobiales bacterium]